MLQVLFSLLFLLALAPGLQAAPSELPSAADAPVERPRIAIILDDLGYNRPAGERALQLPGQVTYAIIPFTPYAATMARAAHGGEREVILHLPMASQDPERRLDRGGLTDDMDEAEVRSRVQQALRAVPHIAGLNNHMGSQITADVQIMHWLMQEVQETPLYFIDSMTSSLSVANQSALHYQIPSLKRDVFLDNVQTPEAVDQMFQSLLRIARRRGHAIAIGHPYPTTLAYLEQALPRLQQQGVELVAASELVQQYGQPVYEPVDLKQLMRQIVAMPAPRSSRLNFSETAFP
ncbi:MAG: divergent polysaccharide deacetylase family protein [Pseudomonadota bacterium]|nr:hypothetical protein [Pseudomonadales bacterium]MDY6920172.1 divergent polysaccharide deacetylase family protein [Pseudomonadota bacterium]